MVDGHALDASAGPGLTITLEKTVSDRTTLEGLTQFSRAAVLAGVKPLKATEIGNGSQDHPRVR